MSEELKLIQDSLEINDDIIFKEQIIELFPDNIVRFHTRDEINTTLKYVVKENFFYDVQTCHNDISLVSYNYLTEEEFYNCCKNTLKGELGIGIWPQSRGYFNLDGTKISIQTELLNVAFRIQNLLNTKAGFTTVTTTSKLKPIPSIKNLVR